MCALESQRWFCKMAAHYWKLAGLSGINEVSALKEVVPGNGKTSSGQKGKERDLSFPKHALVLLIF